MVKLKGNIGALVRGAANEDKREQLIPEVKTSPTPVIQPTVSKTWPASLKSVDEEYIRVRLELPKSLNEAIDRYFFEGKKKGKNEFLFRAIKEYANKQGIKWPK